MVSYYSEYFDNVLIVSVLPPFALMPCHTLCTYLYENRFFCGLAFLVLLYRDQHDDKKVLNFGFQSI